MLILFLSTFAITCFVARRNWLLIKAAGAVKANEKRLEGCKSSVGIVNFRGPCRLRRTYLFILWFKIIVAWCVHARLAAGSALHSLLGSIYAVAYVVLAVISLCTISLELTFEDSVDRFTGAPAVSRRATSDELA